jgi:ribose 1,5-bisphosphokinase PhnN
MNEGRRKILERIKESLEGIQVPLDRAAKDEAKEAKSGSEMAVSDNIGEAAAAVEHAIEELSEALES